MTDSKVLAGIAARTIRELQATEDALVAHIVASKQRETVYDQTRDDLGQRYPALNQGR